MLRARAIKKVSRIQWKIKDSITISLIIFGGLLFSFIGLFFNRFYDIFFSMCFGLFIGGIFLSIISFFLAQMESNISGTGELDAEVDVDIDAEVDVDIDAEVDVDIDAEVDVDVDAEVDVDIDYDIEAEIGIDAGEVDLEVDVEAGVDADSDLDVDIEAEAEIDIDIMSTITPAPIMLLFSSALLIFGISGILFFQLFEEPLRFLILFISPLIAYVIVKFLNYFWKILAKSRYYAISSTKNLIGIQGEVLLDVDYRGGIIKIPSSTPMRFEKIHVKPTNKTSRFERGDKVYICDVKDGYLLIDNNRKSIKKRR